MSDLIELERGRRPWRPLAGAEPILVLHRYNHPLMGVIREPSGGLHFFECVVGAASPLSLWWYCPITSAEYEQLEDIEAPKIREIISTFLTTRRCVVALSVEDEGLVTAVPVEDFGGVEADIEELFRRFKDYTDHLNRATDSEGELRDQMKYLTRV